MPVDWAEQASSEMMQDKLLTQVFGVFYFCGYLFIKEETKKS